MSCSFINTQVTKMKKNAKKCNLRYSSVSAYYKVLLLLLTQNGGITERKKSKRHMPRNTAKMSPFTLFTCGRVHSVILCTLPSDSCTQGHSMERRQL